MENNLHIDYKKVELNGLPPEFFQQHREKYRKTLASAKEISPNGIIILQGGDEIPRFDTDVCYYHFQQEASFYYLTGVREPSCYTIYEVSSGEVTIYINLSQCDKVKIFCTVPTLDELSQKYKLTFKHSNDMYNDIALRNPDKIYVLKGINSDSGSEVYTAKLNFPQEMTDIESKIDNSETAYELLAETRTVKTKDEIALLQFINNATIEGHNQVFKQIKPGMVERDAENIFVNFIRAEYYARIWAYPCICGTGEDSATLHYQKNDITIKDGDLLLLDMGARLGGYIADVTTTLPVNGKFTEKQKNIYDLVLLANRTVMNLLKPGVLWPDMHLEAEKVILNGLKKLYILNDYDIKEMLDKRVAYYFFPHGLGHFFGAEVHDVGGYLSSCPKRRSEVGLRSLRTARMLKEGNAITVEPGIYFIRFLIDKAYADEQISKYLNKEVLESYMDLGGVRIEDDVIITENGFINLTQVIARTTEEIEALMKH
jgi:Xaa-Pro dipeptidase